MAPQRQGHVIWRNSRSSVPVLICVYMLYMCMYISYMYIYILYVSFEEILDHRFQCMFVCADVHVHIIHVNMWMHMCICAQILDHRFRCSHVYIHIIQCICTCYTCVYAYYTCMYVHVCMCTCIYTYYTYICVNTCIYTYYACICVYIQGFKLLYYFSHNFPYYTHFTSGAQTP